MIRPPAYADQRDMQRRGSTVHRDIPTPWYVVDKQPAASSWDANKHDFSINDHLIIVNKRPA